MTESINKYSANGLDEFLSYLGEKGLMAKQAVAARRAASNKILGILDSNERADVRLLDLDAVATRFNNLEGKRYTPDSLKTYKSRVSKAIEDFVRYLDNPAGFKIKSPSAKKPINGSGRSKSDKGGDRSGDSDCSPPKSTNFERPIETLAIPIPVRPESIVTVSGIPLDLRRSEAQKIANVLLALAGEDE